MSSLAPVDVNPCPKAHKVGQFSCPTIPRARFNSSYIDQPCSWGVGQYRVSLYQPSESFSLLSWTLLAVTRERRPSCTPSTSWQAPSETPRMRRAVELLFLSASTPSLCRQLGAEQTTPQRNLRVRGAHNFVGASCAVVATTRMYVSW